MQSADVRRAQRTSRRSRSIPTHNHSHRRSRTIDEIVPDAGGLDDLTMGNEVL